MPYYAVRYADGDDMGGKPFRRYFAEDRLALADLLDAEMDVACYEFSPWKRDVSRMRFEAVVPSGMGYFPSLGFVEASEYLRRPDLAVAAQIFGCSVPSPPSAA